ncbi:Spliceosomal protein FBP11/Splicing factor PRP40 [Plasmopara halstedii]|uniref:Spliceosomal protein FBP11/Splicing factor PRP40 n=1 Tax=Plasmopara halstedii TaxID=4781 RepID=A0A0N7L830_PLAHL|nr:Spliceosomal protein FBP11/Splicing factor PRP40 [Plasmopara halstedii]CEG48731.1 Spliceosomal protein FBP11/Splicing factor PRP40 [Plasmopara halstedii]|eukprot:XP_024585100.1 Spliceosomal protein FBP11/Splicing factor PRP40 [Plasmopara halstedii]
MGDLDLSDTERMTKLQLFELNALQVVGDWSVHDDGDGHLFYHNFKSGISQWIVPEDLAALETEFMMKLMLQNAVARSNVWTAHDAGNGTLYYFNSKTRQSVWERPCDWGKLETNVENKTEREVQEEKENEKVITENQEKRKRQNHELSKTKQGEAAKEQLELHGNIQLQEEDLPLTIEERRLTDERQKQEEKGIELFRVMLRDKNIMPFCKWSVALPQIAGDPRFLGVPTMDKRRVIFENFVKHRREELKLENKGKLKQAKTLFANLLSEHFRLDTWEPSTTLSVFLSTLETHIDAERYKNIQENALALLKLSTQEKIYAKAVADFKMEALKRDGEQLRLMNYFDKKIHTEGNKTLQWESDELQNLLREYYSNAALSGEAHTLLSKDRQRQIFEELILRRCASARDETEPGRLQSSTKKRTHSSGHKHDVSNSRRESRQSRNNNRLRSRSVSRSKSYERNRSFCNRRNSRHRSSSSSQSSSHKKHSSRSHIQHRRRLYSPSRSRSRTRR